MVNIHEYLILATLLFACGMMGVVSRKNLFIIYLSIELMLNAVNLGLVALGRYFNHLDGTIMAIMIIAVAAAEAALFFTMIILLFKHKRSVNVDLFQSLKRQDVG
jgi:NADH-quinone oxidoreductase subunit K